MASETLPATSNNILPSFPEPDDADFDNDIKEEERKYYLDKFKDLNAVLKYKLHCTACNKHLGTSIRKETQLRSHPMLHTLMCNSCFKFYNSGEFDRGEDGSELYCRWCGQGGQVFCCSDCIHVFCAKCIKKNLGPQKIKEIENTEEWKCFKCSPECLWEARSVCWALLRYCNLRKKLIQDTSDKELKQKYTDECLKDLSECCKDKKRLSFNTKSAASSKKEEVEVKKTVTETKPIPDETVSNTIAKIPSTIMVKKFASMAPDNNSKNMQKRSYNQVMMNKPIAIAPLIKPLQIRGPYLDPQTIPRKRMRFQIPKPTNISPRIIGKEGFISYFPRPKPPGAFYNNVPNGYNDNDNLNLSLENLTQGLDFDSIAARGSSVIPESDVVCTPDLPLEPLCEVREDNDDDDIECITPATSICAPKQVMHTVKPSDNDIIQMTDKDVTVNTVTGGLKFRVDPQTLSSNKMYRLPDGRVFSINANPNLPGGYSATIVAVEQNRTKAQTGQTFAAKITPLTILSSPPLLHKSTKVNKLPTQREKTVKSKQSKNLKPDSYRYCLIDAIDCLEYSLSRLRSLQSDANNDSLKNTSKSEIRRLHKVLDQILKVSSTRFEEVRQSLHKIVKQPRTITPRPEKSNDLNVTVDDDDDDVEILSNNDDPIYIDENSTESNTVTDSQVDLVSSDANESGEKGDRRTTYLQAKSPEHVNLDNSKERVEDIDPLTNEIQDKDGVTENGDHEMDDPLTDDHTHIDDLNTIHNEDSCETSNSNDKTEKHKSNNTSNLTDSSPKNKDIQESIESETINGSSNKIIHNNVTASLNDTQMDNSESAINDNSNHNNKVSEKIAQDNKQLCTDNVTTGDSQTSANTEEVKSTVQDTNYSNIINEIDDSIENFLGSDENVFGDP